MKTFLMWLENKDRDLDNLIIKIYKNNTKSRPATIASIVRNAGYNIGWTTVSNVIQRWKEKQAYASSILNRMKTNKIDTTAQPSYTSSHYSTYDNFQKSPENDDPTLPSPYFNQGVGGSGRNKRIIRKYNP